MVEAKNDAAELRRKVIRADYRNEAIWDVLINESAAKAGPSDGACLICAKAILHDFGRGELVRIVSDANGGQTEHYGALVDGVIYDLEGDCNSPEEWIKRFSELEAPYVRGRKLSFAFGLDEKSEIVDDEAASRKVANLMKCSA